MKHCVITVSYACHKSIRKLTSVIELARANVYKNILQHFIRRVEFPALLLPQKCQKGMYCYLSVVAVKVVVKGQDIG